MIRGRVVEDGGLEPRVPITVVGLDDLAETFDMTLDTGFTGYLALPPDAIGRLRLPFSRYASYLIAGEREVKIPVHLAFVELDGERFEADVLAQDGEPLAGMALITGFRLTIEVTTDGTVSLEAL